MVIDKSEIIILESGLKKISCTIESVQIQSNRSICGLFAIAFAYEVCTGLANPSHQFYNEEKMRKHLFKCLRDKRFSEFPKISSGSFDDCYRSVERTMDFFI